MRFRNIIYGRPADAGLDTLSERNWHYGSDGRIWHREVGDQRKEALVAPSVYEFNPQFDLVRRLAAKRADWDGRSWTAVPSPNVGDTSNMLKDVDATSPTDVWAVGWYVDQQHYRPLVEHWDGTRWKLVSTPDVGTGDGFLSGVAAVGPRDVWAVGWTGRGDSLQPLVEHWDGRTWSVVPGPPGAEHGALMAVAATSTGVVTVGRLLTTAQPQPLALVRVGAVTENDITETLSQQFGKQQGLDARIKRLCRRVANLGPLGGFGGHRGLRYGGPCGLTDHLAACLSSPTQAHRHDRGRVSTFCQW